MNNVKQKIPVRVLYVEDEDIIREQLERLLKRIVSEVVTACDGKQGLEFFDKYAPDIIVTDIKMPKMNGLEMSKAIRNSDKIVNDLFVNLKDLDRKEQELLKDWIYEGVHAGKEISGEIMNWLSRGIGKNITTVAGRIEKMFNGKGQQIGSKSIQETIKKAVE